MASIIVGLETYPSFTENYGTLVNFIEHLILGFFIGEIFIKIGAEASHPWSYFKNGWNLFDLFIVVALLLPIDNQYFIVLRMLRLLRVFRLISALPRLQILVRALLKSLPSMGYVFLLLCILFYIYGVAGTFLFAENDPIHFSSLPKSILSLFQVVTLEGWADLMYIQMYGCERYGYDGIEALCTNPSASPLVGVLFFVSFVMLGAMITINLFVGIITSNISDSVDEFKQEQDKKLEKVIKEQNQFSKVSRLEGQLLAIQEQLKDMHSSLERIRTDISDY
ncbi:MAG: ion transporter [Moorea sp. SIO3I7]|nr:ion transporter [Moorena sp. SIO3I7]NEO10160.1 ion transporter [Moorena sp. SIO3I8]NEO21314.1 ion transporter [Moorena sp. SIO4A5]NEP26462.1 ion transporter [Moorena sp. SIO3I6]NEQ62153.1 ion transporter [Moorena sp. SIO4A1]